MAYTFLKAQGYEIGKSLVDDTKLDYCKEMMEKAEKLGKKLLLPVDSVTITDFPNPIDAPVEIETYDVANMPQTERAVTLDRRRQRCMPRLLRPRNRCLERTDGCIREPDPCKRYDRSGTGFGRHGCYHHHRRR